jgi:HD-like signal output (HDOD) protein
MSSALLLKQPVTLRQAVSPTPRSNTLPAGPAQVLLDQLSTNPDIPGIGTAILRIVRLTETSERNVRDLVQALLAEAFIAQKVIRAANVVVDKRGNKPVTTVSKAIVVLGLEQVRALALSTLLTDRLRNRKQAARIQEEMGQTLYAATLARELAATRRDVESEEASVCALFRGFGRLMAALYLHQPYEQALELAHQEHITPSQAAARTLGMGFDRLGVEILSRWHLPQVIVQAALPCAGEIRPSANPNVYMRTLSQFCVDVAEAVREPQLLARRKRVEPLLERFGAALGLTRSRLKEALHATDQHTAELGQTLGIFGMPVAGQCLDELSLLTLSPSNRPGASLTLGAGVMSLARMHERDEPADARLKHATEVLQRAFGFQRVVLCLKRPVSRMYSVRFVAGKPPRTDEVHFGFVEMTGHDLFNAAVLQNADVYIRDATDARLQKNLPAWFHRTCADAKSFLLLPLGGDSGCAGFFYADHREANQSALTREEVDLVKGLKRQAWIAAHQAR